MEQVNRIYCIQGIPVAEICREFGTPLYVYDADRIKGQIKNLRYAFRETNLRIKYAAKALTTLAVLRLMNHEGVGVDVVSIEEIRLALHAGIVPENITFTPSGVDFDEIREAVSLGVLVNLDNLSALEKFGKEFGSSKACSIRLNPGIMAGGNIKIATGHGRAKFGITIDHIDEIKNLVTQYGIRVTGLHIHTGSEISDPEVFIRSAEVFFDVSRHFPDLTFIDFGGGFKVAYKDDDIPTDINAIGSRLATAFNAFCERYGRKLELWVEPGKYLVSEAGILLVKVNAVKETPLVTFACVNSGLNHLIRPMMYDAYHRIVNTSNPDGPHKKYDVVGYICETDTFGQDRMLNEVREGDILAILNAGAYGFTMASNYNSRVRPAEVMVEEGKAVLIRERETFEDLLKGQK